MKDQKERQKAIYLPGILPSKTPGKVQGEGNNVLIKKKIAEKPPSENKIKTF